MIFYDLKQRRKYYVRAGTLLFLMVIAAFVLHVYFIIFTNNSDAFSYAYDIENAPKKQIVLTFDDGPHSQNTREIFDILDKYNVPATFFFVGKNMLQYPDIVRETYERGFEIGNHSFTHSEDVQKSKRRIMWELNTTNEIIENNTDHGTKLYRPPFLLDLDHEEREVITNNIVDVSPPLQWATELGYAVISGHIDPRDWETNNHEIILQNILNSLDHGNFIILHDGGGHGRDGTIKALPLIIETLETQGYEFVSVGEFMGLSRDESMPAVGKTNAIKKFEYSLFGGLITHSGDIIPTIIWFTLVLSVFRIISLLTLSVFARTKRDLKEWNDGVSILIPAYNEEANIEATVRSAAQSSHKIIEIIVVDDGSTDRTAEIIRALQDGLDEDIRLIQIPNGGKANALNVALRHASYEVAVAIDGDTIIHRYAVSWLAAYFNDPSVGAVTGKIEAIATRNILSKFQNVEYTVGQNIEKNAFRVLDAISIVPGAIGAWRRKNVIDAGGYTDETLVEDQDLTFAMHKLGHRVLYEPRALAYTEVPQKTRYFIKQRFRWIFGSMQCIWKYRTSLFSLRSFSLGWIILPYNFLYIVLLPLLWPIIDGYMLFILVSGTWTTMLYAYLAFVIVDIIYSGIGFASEKRKWHLMFFVPFQRLYYRYTVSFVILYSIIKAIEGTRAFWGKMERSGSAQRLFNERGESVAVYDTTANRLASS